MVNFLHFPLDEKRTGCKSIHVGTCIFLKSSVNTDAIDSNDLKGAIKSGFVSGFISVNLLRVQNTKGNVTTRLALKLIV